MDLTIYKKNTSINSWCYGIVYTENEFISDRISFRFETTTYWLYRWKNFVHKSHTKTIRTQICRRNNIKVDSVDAKVESSVNSYHISSLIKCNAVEYRYKKKHWCPDFDVHHMENPFYHSMDRTMCLVSLHSSFQSHLTCWLSAKLDFHESHHISKR